MFEDPETVHPSNEETDISFIFSSERESPRVKAIRALPEDLAPIEELRALGLDLGSDEALAQRIQGALWIAEGRAQQSHCPPSHWFGRSDHSNKFWIR